MESRLQIFLLHNKSKACLLIRHVAIYYDRYVIRLHHRKTLKKLLAAIRSRIYIYMPFLYLIRMLQLSYGRHLRRNKTINLGSCGNCDKRKRAFKEMQVNITQIFCIYFLCLYRSIYEKRKIPLPLSTFWLENWKLNILLEC